MSDTFKWDVTPGQAFDELWDAYTNTMFVVGGRVMGRKAREMEAWAKQNAPWTDRTFQARPGIQAVVEENPGTIGTIILRHTAPHGLWLEIAYGGKWAIIAPAIDYWGPKVMRDIQGMMNLGLISR